MLTFAVMDHTQTIQLYRPMLQTIAFNIVRCKQDAEDIVQETFIKWLSAEHHKIQNTRAYLIKAVTNNCINHLNSFNRKKVEYLENVSEAFLKFKESNLSHLDLELDVSKALQVVSHRLEPLERAVYLLKEVFDFDYDALQETLNKKKDHCRQLFCRARKKINDETARISFPSPSGLIESFRNACDMGNPAGLIQELKKDL